MKHFPVVAAVIVLATLLYAISCISLTRPYKEIFNYQIAYDPPETKGLPYKNVVVRVAAFSVAPPFDKQKIMYSTGPNLLAVYEYHTWVTNPGDMLSDLLIRDMIVSDFYEAVVDPRSSMVPQYELEGVIEQIYEKTDGEIWWSVLKLRGLFFAYDGGKHVLFQRVYLKEVQTAGRELTDIVAAMGEAAQAISVELQPDVNAAVAKYESEKILAGRKE
ncbi:MAG: hypothetical protein C4523_14105 [Myxococcales bacterium]|nr:MAG: hypothetical protein C4523_14105 [Myxococcales bacterium]